MIIKIIYLIKEKVHTHTASNLVSNHKTGELFYNITNYTRDEDRKNKLIVLVMNVALIVFYKFIAPLGLVFCGLYIFDYWYRKKECSKSIKSLDSINKVTDSNKIEEISKHRLNNCNTLIEIIKIKIIKCVECLNKSNVLEKQVIEKLELKNIIKPYTKESFNWSEFIHNNFFDSLNLPDVLESQTLQDLRDFQIQLSRLSIQKELILNSSTSNRIKILKSVIELSVIKQTYLIYETKKNAINSLCMIIPFFNFIKNFYDNDKEIFAEKKEFLPTLSCFREFKDVVDAHNQLILRNDFLVPLLRPTRFKLIGTTIAADCISEEYI